MLCSLLYLPQNFMLNSGNGLVDCCGVMNCRSHHSVSTVSLLWSKTWSFGMHAVNIVKHQLVLYYDNEYLYWMWWVLWTELCLNDRISINVRGKQYCQIIHFLLSNCPFQTKFSNLSRTIYILCFPVPQTNNLNAVKKLPCHLILYNSIVKVFSRKLEWNQKFNELVNIKVLEISLHGRACQMK